MWCWCWVGDWLDLKRLFPTLIPCFYEGLLLLPMTQWWVVEHIPAHFLWRISRNWNQFLGGSKQHIFLLLIPKMYSLDAFIHSFLITVFLRLLKVLCKNAVSLTFTVNCFSLFCEITWNRMFIVPLISVVLLHFVARISNLLWVVTLGLNGFNYKHKLGKHSRFGYKKKGDLSCLNAEG